MLNVYRHMFKIPDLRGKILFTLGIFALYRLGATVPVPGIELDRLDALAGQRQGGAFGLLNLFSGNALENLSVFSLGILPYITASIIMQLLSVVIPKLQKLQDEGESGRAVITKWTRIVTVVLALLQSTGITYLFSRGSSFTGGVVLIEDYTPTRVVLMVVTMTAGTAFVMWLGELITQRGVGNGMSLLIFISIVAALPSQFSLIWQFTVPAGRAAIFVFIIALFVFMVVGIIYVEQGQRRIPIQFAKRIRGRRVMGGQSTYIPLKINMAGVIPVIFATSILFFPVLISTSIPSTEGFFSTVREFINVHLAPSGYASGATSWVYIGVLFFLIVFFTYFYTAIQFDPVRQSEMIQRQGGFIPGQRPGRQTARYLERILNRITLPGAIFLGMISILPAIASAIWAIPVGFSGVSILIVVGVALETMKQIESQLTMRNYEGFLT